MEVFFCGVFLSFVLCKDDFFVFILFSIVGCMWWQWVGQCNFQCMVEVEYYDGVEFLWLKEIFMVEIDEVVIQDFIDNWDDLIVDLMFVEVMGIKFIDYDKEVEEILEEVSDLIEMFVLYQCICNFNFLNFQNRQISDFVNGDMFVQVGLEFIEEE